MREIDVKYLERRCAINELVLLDLGELVARHLPACFPQLKEMGAAWQSAIDNLDAEYK
jgi:hypothetical protein